MKIHHNLRCIWSKNIGLGILVLFVALMVVPGTSSAQTSSTTDLSSIRVDDLTDEQILNYINQAKARGLGQSEVEVLARQQGLPESEILKLKTRILNLNGQEPSAANTAVSSSDRYGTSEALSVNSSFGLTVNDNDPNLTPEERRIFGFSFFRKNGLSFSPNLSLPTPVDYLLGPGDELMVDLWGTTQQFFLLPVSKEGTIRPKNLGPIYVNGLTIEKATKRIVDRLAQVYSGLKEKEGRPPSIFYQVSLGTIRTINVEVVGAVSQPGIYALPSLATGYMALHAAGGPLANGTFRNIRLMRDNKLLTTIDIYTFLTQGIRSGDVRLKHGDVIVVPPYESRVELTGQIKTPGLFELRQEETFQDILGFANGFTDMAFREGITLRRNGATERELIDISSDEFNSFHPQSGDKIEVGKIFERFSNRLVVKGAVFRPGEYQLEEGITLRGVIERAGGLRPDAFMERITIYRLGNDYSQEVLPVNLEAVLNGEVADVPLSNEDIITINSMYDLEEERYVTISGEVMESGIYPYFRQMTVKDLVILAGGFKESASGAFIEIARRNTGGEDNNVAEILTISISEDLSLPLENEQVTIQPFDQVYIRRSLGYTVQKQITIEGEVVAPGPYVISKKNERISDVIKRARGFTPYAFLEGAILIRQTEFDKSRAADLINPAQLQQLRDRILSGKSQLRGSGLSGLLERIEKLKSRVESANSQDLQGSNFKKNLVEGIMERDSLIQDLNITPREPVAIELVKIMENPGSKYDLILNPGDIISVPGKLETVRVTGEVRANLSLRFDPSYSFKDYIQQSGGLLQTAKLGRSYVQHPNGERSGVRRFLWFRKFPKIQPGSIIILSKKPPKNQLRVQDVLGVTSSLATMFLLIDRIGSN